LEAPPLTFGRLIMDYKCIRGTVTSKGVAAVGDVVSGLPDLEARTLMAAGKLVPYAAPEVIRVADAPVAQHRDPAGKRRR